MKNEMYYKTCSSMMIHTDKPLYCSLSVFSAQLSKEVWLMVYSMDCSLCIICQPLLTCSSIDTQDHHLSTTVTQ